MNNISFGNFNVGDNNPCFIIAEIGGSFRNFEEAKRLIDSAIEIGVNAVKFQTLEADTVTTKNNFFDMKATGYVSQYEVLKEFEISKELQREIVKYAKEKNILIFSAPSHMNDLEIMKELELPIYKIGSDLSCHIPLLKKIAKLGKPIILSTGMCNLEEVKESIDAITSTGNDQIILLHCVSNYPSEVEELNLNAISTMKNEFDLPVGLSDHTIGTTTTLVGAVMGANVIERHLRDERNTPSTDDIHALTKEEFSSLIKEIRIAEAARGTGEKLPTKSELKNMITNKVSVVSLKEIKKGEIITPEMIDIKRPGTGIQPKFYDKILGMKAKIDILKESPLSFEMLE